MSVCICSLLSAADLESARDYQGQSVRFVLSATYFLSMNYFIRQLAATPEYSGLSQNISYCYNDNDDDDDDDDYY